MGRSEAERKLLESTGGAPGDGAGMHPEVPYLREERAVAFQPRPH